MNEFCKSVFVARAGMFLRAFPLFSGQSFVAKLEMKQLQLPAGLLKCPRAVPAP